MLMKAKQHAYESKAACLWKQSSMCKLSNYDKDKNFKIWL